MIWNWQHQLKKKNFKESCDLHDFVIIAPFHFTNSNLRCDDNFVKLLFRQIYYRKQLINKCVFYHVPVSYLAHYHQEMKSGECQFCNMNMKKKMSKQNWFFLKIEIQFWIFFIIVFFRKLLRKQTFLNMYFHAYKIIFIIFFFSETHYLRTT